MTADAFRKLALALPEVIEAEHMGHPDFRVGGKVLATLGPDGDWGMVKLTPEQQAQFVLIQPEAFQPFPGAWGRRGCTKVTLAAAKTPAAREALRAAWRNTAPKKLADRLDDE